MARQTPNPNTEETPFHKGYDEKDYQHAKDAKGDWTKEAQVKGTTGVRSAEYQKRLDIFKTKLRLQDIGDIQHKKEPYDFIKGDTLYPALKDWFEMNNHTAFFVMVKMLNEGINVDLIHPGDSIAFTPDGTMTFKPQNGAAIVIRDILKTTTTDTGGGHPEHTEEDSLADTQEEAKARREASKKHPPIPFKNISQAKKNGDVVKGSKPNEWITKTGFKWADVNSKLNFAVVEEKADNRPAPAPVPETKEVDENGINNLTDSNFEAKLKTGVWIVDVWADWCVPCRAMKPTFGKIAKSHTDLVPSGYTANINFAQADRSQAVAQTGPFKNPKMAADSRLNVPNLPTFLIIKNGRIIASIEGAKDEAAFRQLLSEKLKRVLNLRRQGAEGTGTGDLD
ncbi:thioredoxin family protein [Candidatus Peregrinibacteria bacterium]|nr:thioredoxin family protein [Candidatus Peregrinibacteria bacterium]